jgi:hypothetical protein
MMGAHTDSRSCATVTVTVTPLNLEFVAKKLLPHTCYAVGVDKVYRLYVCAHAEPFRLTAPNGAVLVEGHVFSTQTEARCWAIEDDRQRRLLYSSDQTIQQQFNEVEP